MTKPPLPPTLQVAAWERQGGALAKQKPALVADALAELKKTLDAIDAGAFDVAAVEDEDDLEPAAKRIDAEADRRVKPALGAVDKVCAAVDKLLRGVNRRDAALRAAADAADAVKGAAAALRAPLEDLAPAARKALETRRKELDAAAAKAERDAKDSPEVRKLRTRLVDQFRIVKMRPDQTVLYLLCVGNRSAAAFLGRTASDSNKPLLTKVLKGDGNFKFFRGQVKWEDGAYTFVGPKMNATLARRIQEGVRDLSGANYRVRAHD